MEKYYDAFLYNTLSPFNEFCSFEQELINEDFESSPTWYSDIEQEIEFGSLKFKKIDARINHSYDTSSSMQIKRWLLHLIDTRCPFAIFYSKVKPFWLFDK